MPMPATTRPGCRPRSPSCPPCPAPTGCSALPLSRLMGWHGPVLLPGRMPLPLPAPPLRPPRLFWWPCCSCRLGLGLCAPPEWEDGPGTLLCGRCCCACCGGGWGGGTCECLDCSRDGWVCSWCSRASSDRMSSSVVDKEAASFLRAAQGTGRHGRGRATVCRQDHTHHQSEPLHASHKLLRTPRATQVSAGFHM